MMFGVLTIAVRIYHDRQGYGVYSGPVGMAVLIIAAKWVRTGCPPQTGSSPLSPSPPTSGAGGRLDSASANTQGKGPLEPSHTGPVCSCLGPG